MIPLKGQCPLPTYRIGAVPAGGTHLGKKNDFKQMKLYIFLLCSLTILKSKYSANTSFSPFCNIRNLAIKCQQESNMDRQS